MSFSDGIIFAPAVNVTPFHYTLASRHGVEEEIKVNKIIGNWSLEMGLGKRKKTAENEKSYL